MQPDKQPQQKNENQKYENSMLEKINRPVALAARFHLIRLL
jgi:hypothetical protein